MMMMMMMFTPCSHSPPLPLTPVSTSSLLLKRTQMIKMFNSSLFISHGENSWPLKLNAFVVEARIEPNTFRSVVMRFTKCAIVLRPTGLRVTNKQHTYTIKQSSKQTSQWWSDSGFFFFFFFLVLFITRTLKLASTKCFGYFSFFLSTTLEQRPSRMRVPQRLIFRWTFLVYRVKRTMCGHSWITPTRWSNAIEKNATKTCIVMNCISHAGASLSQRLMSDLFFCCSWKIQPSSVRRGMASR
jgi:hypothetical protein